MSEAMSTSLNRTTFALQSRLFVAMKRAGRVIDLVWLQHNAEYARAVLDIAGHMQDEEVRDIARRLRGLLGDYLAQGTAKVALLRPAPAPAPAVSVVPPTPPVAVALPPAEAAPVAPAGLDRHLTSLR
ncbi:MAG: hypothetical protein K0Q68_120 [Moraxellaceae bacterium]|jgi:hypothetical protein|nr:hypothetical protein [Moraxellaceae bacterium]